MAEAAATPAREMRAPYEMRASGRLAIGKQLNLATSTCRRKLGADGSLCEIVRLDGMRAGLSDADFEGFIASFPIERPHGVFGLA